MAINEVQNMWRTNPASLCIFASQLHGSHDLFFHLTGTCIRFQRPMSLHVGSIWIARFVEVLGPTDFLSGKLDVAKSLRLRQLSHL